MPRGRERPTCVVESCNRLNHGHGYCRLHLRRFQLYGTPLGGKKPLLNPDELAAMREQRIREGDLIPHHYIKVVDAERREGWCATCGPIRLAKAGTETTGKPKFRCPFWRSLARRQAADPKRPYVRLVKKETCEQCGFVAEHPCQLDVHHLDGNRQNNLVSNLQVLCANCHRLETHQQREEVRANAHALWSLSV